MKTQYQIVILFSGTLPFMGPIVITRLLEKRVTAGKTPLKCEVVEECDFVKGGIDGRNYGKGRSANAKVNAVLRKHACGLNERVKKVSTHFLLKTHMPIQYH